MWSLFSTQKRPSGFSASSTAEEVTQGIDGTGLTAIVTVQDFTSSETPIRKIQFWKLRRASALRGLKVVMAVRSLEAADKVKEAISQQVHGAKVHPMELDLSSTESVRQFAKEFNSSGRPLNILMLNDNPIHFTKRWDRATRVCFEKWPLES